jgi:5'-nucleotidase/UDP-sugar diphosphatase
MRRRIFFLALLGFCCALVLFCPAPGNDGTKTVVILSLADLHGRLDPALELRAEGDGRDVVERGGLAGVASVAEAMRLKHPGAVLFVCCGDDFGGPYFLKFRGRATCSLLSRIGVDVGTLGNHELDIGASTLADALSCCDFPIVESNVVLKPHTPLSEKLVDYRVFERGGVRIGVLGLLGPGLCLPARDGAGVEVRPDLVSEARRAARELRRKERVDLVVALTHAGIEADMTIARRVGEIDLICGGHSHIVLPRGDELVFRHRGGRSTIVTHPGSYGRTLGVLKLGIRRGRIVSHDWEPVSIDARVPIERSVETLLESFRKGLPEETVLTATQVPVDLQRAALRTGEAAIGDFICDSLRCRLGVDIVLLNGGAFRGDRVIPPGPVTTRDIDAMLPFEDRIVVLRLRGSVVREALEHGISALPEPFGGFLQVSGLRFVVNEGGAPGGRILTVEAEGGDGGYGPLGTDRFYRVAVNDFLAGGGDGYSMMEGAEILSRSEGLLTETVEEILETEPEIAPAVDGRIRIER